MGWTRARQSSLGVLLASLGAVAAAPGCSVQETAEGEAAGSADAAPATPADGADAGAVSAGVDVLLADSLHLLRGRAVGLITNHTGVGRGADGGLRSTVDLLHEHPEVRLVALYGPEHGIRGDAEAGEHVDDGVDDRTGLPVHSLYGASQRPDSADLAGIEVLVFDIQDVGARYYTYVWSMSLAMETAGRLGIPFVVLDRPNPIGGAVQGNVLEPAFSSFIGLHPVPMRHGLTPGELARLLVAELGVSAELHVVPAAGWRRDMLFPETGLPWIAPSPNMPSFESALHYPGTCLFEGTNLSVGRGTDAPFQQIGAPWLDAAALVAALEERALPGVRFETVSFTPVDPGDAKYDGEELAGVRFVATDPEAYQPVRTAVAALVEARRIAGERWAWRAEHFDRLAGTDALRLGIEAGDDVDALTASWDAQIARFRERSAPYLIYPGEAPR